MNAENHRTLKLGSREISYTFRPAEKPAAPLLLILHGHSKKPAASRYRNPAYNILCPIDNFGYEGWGSWYLGEHGDHFWLEAISKLIELHQDSPDLFFCGSSMGGYGAILHGVLNEAKAVYANIPQTLLLGSSYSDGGMKKFFEPIFAPNEPSRFNNLTEILTPGLPTSFILSGIRWDKPRYIEEQTLPFIQRLCELKINFQSEIHFGEGHQLTYTVAESIDLFSKYAAEIDSFYEKAKL